MRPSFSLRVLSIAALMASSTVFAAGAPLRYEVRPYSYQSPAPSARVKPGAVVVSTVVRADGAPWLRLEFGSTQLGPNAVLRLTSLLDGRQQHLTADALRQWQGTSAYFNGDAVRVELIAGSQPAQDRFALRSILVGMTQATAVEPESQCGGSDDRVPSSAPDRARLLDVGCTANLVGDACFITAGHCLSSSRYVDVVEFNVPTSDANGSLNHPGPEDQYVPTSSRDHTDSGIGNDWGVFTVSANTETGLTPYAAQGTKLDFASGVPGVGDLAEIIGYGVDDGSANQTQQYGAGPITTVTGTSLSYQADTEGGNSGSAVLVDGKVVGIHTHGGCSTSGGSGANSGTLYTHPDLQEALGAICNASSATPSCNDVVSLRARCSAGAISATVKLSSSAFNGHTLGFTIDGAAYSATVDGSTARLRANGFRNGSHQVELVEPAACQAPVEVRC